jgi:hypothetical protein|tara:strand:- start:1337 stop:1516 length:180 start_codon:yes stop_codon:yes gene_type:complete
MNGLNDLTSKWKGSEDAHLLVLGGMYVAYSMFAGSYNQAINAMALIGAVYGLSFIWNRI